MFFCVDLHHLWQQLREPLELLDEIEQRIGLRPTPVNWPVGVAGDFRGLIERTTVEYTAYTRTPGGADRALETPSQLPAMPM
jgi:peptide chain release factor 3